MQTSSVLDDVEICEAAACCLLRDKAVPRQRSAILLEQAALSQFAEIDYRKPKPLHEFADFKFRLWILPRDE